MRILRRSTSAAVVFCAVLAEGQTVSLYPAPSVSFPAPVVDGNSPGYWDDGVLKVFTSDGRPMVMQGSNILDLTMAESPSIDGEDHFPMWIESLWRDTDGLIYAWYHYEPGGLCPPSRLTAPQIGAMISYDGGRSFRDLGIVLASGDPIRCESENGYFAGGNGDFSVILDRERRYFYFLFSNYGGPLYSQGVAVARMAFEDRANPVGAVYKFYQGSWSEPGIGGAVDPVYTAVTAWERSDADSFWGPAVHWNDALQRHVVLLNHSCCEPGWPQEGIYVAFIPDLSNPYEWTKPAKLLDGSELGIQPGWYPQVFGSAPGDSDTQASQFPRLFVTGTSSWELYFERIPEEGLSQRR